MNGLDSPLFVMYGDQETWSQYVSAQYFHLFRTLRHAYGWTFGAGDASGGWGPFGEAIVGSLGGRTPDVLLFVEAYDLLSLLGGADKRAGTLLERTEVWLFINDLHTDPSHALGHGLKASAIAAADLVAGPYMYLLDAFFPAEARGKRREWVPHAATALFQLPLVPQSDPSLRRQVLLSGATYAQYYPYRAHVESLIRRGDARFVQHDHPGWGGNFDPRTVGGGYAAILSRHLGCITDGLVYNYTVAKVFEMPATGCLLLVNAELAPVLAVLGFTPHVHYVPYDWGSLDDVVDAVLHPANAAAVDRIRAQGQALVWTRHTVAHRAATLHRAAVEAVERRRSQGGRETGR